MGSDGGMKGVGGLSHNVYQILMKMVMEFGFCKDQEMKEMEVSKLP